MCLQCPESGKVEESITKEVNELLLCLSCQVGVPTNIEPLDNLTLELLILCHLICSCREDSPWAIDRAKVGIQLIHLIPVLESKEESTLILGDAKNKRHICGSLCQDVTGVTGEEVPINDRRKRVRPTPLKFFQGILQWLHLVSTNGNIEDLSHVLALQC